MSRGIRSFDLRFSLRLSAESPWETCEGLVSAWPSAVHRRGLPGHPGARCRRRTGFMGCLEMATAQLRPTAPR